VKINDNNKMQEQLWHMLVRILPETLVWMQVLLIYWYL